MSDKEIISWLLEGDVSIQYQTYRDLLDTEKPELQKRIETEGWGLQFLKQRNTNGHWGKGFYQPKWISSHYTLLDLKYLGISPGNQPAGQTIQIILQNSKGNDGGITASHSGRPSDVCINGMFLNYACYFRANETALHSVVDFLLAQKMNDGGFNCQSNQQGCVHSSLHTTLSVLEGIHEYEKNGYTYRLKELKQSESTSREFILMHHLFKSDKTGKIINPNFLKLRYPGRWFYNVLKAMDYFQSAKTPYDKRMDEAIAYLLEKRTKEGFWKLTSGHSGLVHFEMEQAGKPSRWNTLRAMRVLKQYQSVG